jgi:hypothetical protein
MSKPQSRSADSSYTALLGKVSLRKWKVCADGVTMYYAEGSESGWVFVRAANRDYAKAILLELGHITEKTRFYR